MAETTRVDFITLNFEAMLLDAQCDTMHFRAHPSCIGREPSMSRRADMHFGLAMCFTSLQDVTTEINDWWIEFGIEYRES